MNILVTGGAGFIGYWTSKALIERGDTVIIVDNFNDYYDPKLKRARIKQLDGKAIVYEADLADYATLEKIFKKHAIDKICHLGAQAGVRYSVTDPFAYEQSNGLGTLNLLELARHFGIKPFIYASSSSVYGLTKNIPFSEDDAINTPISIYAATKRYNELQAHVYHHLYGLHVTGLRFFTVYGPWGRPDMSLFTFSKNTLQGKPIDLYNNGKMKRDFTYITDIVDGILAALDKAYPCEIFNLGNNKPVELLELVTVFEQAIGKPVKKNMLPLQPGDVAETHADIRKAQHMLGYNPKVTIHEGVPAFVKWYKEHYEE